MMLVVVFLALFLTLLGVASRQIGVAVRVDTVRTQRAQRDEGSLHAVARALTLLETGLPPSDPYVCEVTINTSIGVRSYTVTFSSVGDNQWSVRAAMTAPGETPPPMPSVFAPTGVP
jgi:hypothetical protein